MKKFQILRGLSIAALAFASLTIASCSDDDEGGTTNELEKDYFTIEDATYSESAIPEATTTDEIQGLSINNQAMSGGMNLISIVSQEAYKTFFVGVSGVDGHYIYSPSEQSGSSAYHSYTIPVMYSTTYDSDITMIISAEKITGEITKATEATVEFVESKTGDLDIKLVFSNEKDVDLHLIMPSGREIYYGNRGGNVTLEDGSVITYGLDHDSNAACSIDGLNNENIYVPAELIENGTYTVRVNMWSNCDPTIATSWSIVARYKGELLQNETGANPASGVYPVNAGNGDHTTVMTFTITDGAISLDNNDSAAIPGVKSIAPIARSESDLWKIENDLFDQEF